MSGGQLRIPPLYNVVRENLFSIWQNFDQVWELINDFKYNAVTFDQLQNKFVN